MEGSLETHGISRKYNINIELDHSINHKANIHFEALLVLKYN